MALLGTKVLSRVPFLTRAKGNAGLEESPVSQNDEPRRAPLVMLVSDASGRVSFQQHTFKDAPAGEEFIEYWYHGRPQSGLISFWALPDQPRSMGGEGACAGESVVLIRDGDRPGVVYPFSFVDMQTAHGFVRQEVSKGLDLGQVAIHWAAPVTLEADLSGKVRINPPTPPDAGEMQAGGRAPVQTAAIEETPLSGENVAGMPGFFSPSSQDAMPTAAERRASSDFWADDEVVRKNEVDKRFAQVEAASPVRRPRVETLNTEGFDTRVEPAAKLEDEVPPGTTESIAVEAPTVEADVERDAIALDVVSESTPEAVVLEVEAVLEPAVTFDVPVGEVGASEEEEEVESGPHVEEPIVEAVEAEELFAEDPEPLVNVERLMLEVEEAALGAEWPSARFDTVDEAAGGFGDESGEVEDEVSKVLHTRRWESQDGPFRGFGSPPGKF